VSSRFHTPCLILRVALACATSIPVGFFIGDPIFGVLLHRDRIFSTVIESSLPSSGPAPFGVVAANCCFYHRHPCLSTRAVVEPCSMHRYDRVIASPPDQDRPPPVVLVYFIAVSSSQIGPHLLRH
jgi:hypothetical protein